MMGTKLLQAVRWLSVTVGIVVLTSFTVDATLNSSLSQSALGILASKATEEGCPKGTVRIDTGGAAMCVDAFEVSPGETCPHDTIRNNGDTTANLDAASCLPVSVPDVQPWVYVSYHQARELCARRGMRLLDNNEWYTAGLGTNDRSGARGCNLDSGMLQNTGEHTSCRSPHGVHDMIGNAWEWVDGAVEDGTYRSRSLPKSGYVVDADRDGVALETTAEDTPDAFHDDYFWSNSEGSYGMIRGGFFGSGRDGGLYSIQGQVARSFSGEAVGFRCVMNI